MNLKSEFVRSILILLLFFAGLSFNVVAQQTASLEKLNINSKILNQKRPIFIYTPWNYKERDLVSFDVIYVFDAQNRELFDLVHSSLGFITNSKKFIVVGISSPSYDNSGYYRNSDYLPKPINVTLDKYQTNNPNEENFWKYFKNEVIPFIDNSYRTTNVRYLVGHSLSASFVLDKAINSSEMFKGFISISPNFAYDNYRLADDFLRINFNKPTENKFIYISQSNEPETWAKSWAIGYNKVKTFLDSAFDYRKYTIIIKEFPEYNHWNGYLPSLLQGLTYLRSFIDKNPYSLSEIYQEIIFKITVPNKNDDAFITGNQESLGNWDPSKVKLRKVSEFEREIKLKVQFPVEFKITKGSWKSEATTNQTTNDNENIVITKAKNNEIRLKLIAWNGE
ncbi:MAG: alpha/beta hydrolase-fold protein [Bacteroidota bacterium]